MLIFNISLGFLLVSFILQLFLGRKHFSCRLFKYLFFCFAIFIVSYYFYLVYAQFYAWKNSGPPASYLVPPYRSISYVFGYHFIRFALYYCISLIIALVFLLWMKKTNKRFDGKFFEDEEPYLAAFSIFLLGNFNWNCAWIFYLFSVFGLYFLLHLVNFFRVSLCLVRARPSVVCEQRRVGPRISMYWLWLPVAILIIIINSLFTAVSL